MNNSQGPTGNLFARSLLAASWSYGGTAAAVALQIVASVLFARKLGVQITGVFAFGLLIFAPFRCLCEFGIGSALIQKKDLTSQDVEIAMSRLSVLAVLTAAAWLVCTPWLAASMHQEPYLAALNCFALVFLCLPLQIVCTALLARRLDQKFLQISALIAYAAGYLAVGAYGTARGWEEWSLIGGFLVQNILTTALLCIQARFTLRLRFRGDDRFITHFGSRAAAISVSNWLTSSLDNMAVAWFFGTGPLGIYSLAYTLVRTPADKIVVTLQSVLFPASLLARDDSERLAKGCVAAIDAVFLVAAPAFCVVAVLSDTIVDALYGSAWRGAASVLQPLALAMIFHCLTVVAGALLWGTGAVGRDVRVQWTCAGLLLAAVTVAAHYSLAAVAWTVLPVTMLRALWGLNILSKNIAMARRRMLRAFVGGAVLVVMIPPVLRVMDVILRTSVLSAQLRLALDIVVAASLWAVLSATLRNRLMSPELLAGVQVLRVALRPGSTHA